MREYVVDSPLINEWDWEKNNELGLDPEKITLGSEKQAWWICQYGHNWITHIKNRGKGTQCPYCSNQKVLIGYNDLSTTDKDLSKEWNYERNGELLPTMVVRGSNKKVWWKCCVCSNEWKAIISSRTINGCGCPRCARKFKTSLQEMQLFYYIKKYFADAVSGFSDKENNISEIDVYIPNLKIGIEYDGQKWHQDIERDKKKDLACNKYEINLIRIREPQCPKYESTCNFVELKDMSKLCLSNAISDVLKMIGIIDADVDLDRDLSEIRNLIIYKKVQNSLETLYPDIALEWHPTKNGNFTPNSVTPQSDERVWWLCRKCSNEWITSVATRVRGCGCPECGKALSKQKRLKPVYCIELDKEFESGADASRQTGVSQHGILNCASGKQSYAGKHPITGEKLHWIYAIMEVR